MNTIWFNLIIWKIFELATANLSYIDEEVYSLVLLLHYFVVVIAENETKTKE